MGVRYLVIPQWQGSGSSRAMQLVDGVAAIRGDLPRQAVIDVEVPLEAGDPGGTGIDRFSSLRVVRQHVARALEAVDGPVVAVMGDAGAGYAPVAHAAASGEFALVWFDARPRAHSPGTSATGAFSGMVVRGLVDDGIVPADRVVLAGTRAWDDAEQGWLDEAGCAVVGDLDPAALADAVAATGASAAYLHVDLGVLDPAEFEWLSEPEPFGPGAAALVASIRELVAGFAFAGGAISGFSPPRPDAATDGLPTILRILGALRPAP